MFKEVKKEWPFEVNTTGLVVRNKITKKEYTQHDTWDGYKSVGGALYGKPCQQRVHRLVGIAFIHNPLNKPQINHIDCDKHNNCVANLEWCTNSENHIHASLNGLKNPAYGEDCGSSVLTSEQAHLVCKMIQDGYRNKDISSKLDISRSIIKDVRIGKAWKLVAAEYDMQIIRRGRISEDTVHWICKSMQSGLTNTEIREACTNKAVSASQINHIKNRNSYHDITSLYKY